MKREGIKMSAAFLLLAVSIALIIHGVHIGEVDIVLDKATNICMECIGIG